MTTRPTRALDERRFALLDRISRRTVGQPVADATTRAAVALLTADAAPDRADRLRPRPGEPAVLVERLAVWALHRASDQAVAMADARLDRDLALLRGTADGAQRQTA